MHSIPAHKVVGDIDKPGQIVSKIVFDHGHEPGEPAVAIQSSWISDWFPSWLASPYAASAAFGVA